MPVVPLLSLMNKISAIVITLNEAANLERCLRSVMKVADEVIVLDSFSTDNTVAIANSMGAQVYQHKFDGYGPQKNRAIAYAQYDWILNIDADEELSEALIAGILEAKKNFQHDAYACNRLTNYCGKWIRYGGWYPDRLIRLWHRSKAGVTQDKVHEQFILNQGANAGFIKGDILHYSFNSISDHIKKIQQYSEIGAQHDVARGKKCSLFKLWLMPKMVFIKTFLFKRGFLDGYYGYIISKNSAFAAFAKYAKIREYSKKALQN